MNHKQRQIACVLTSTREPSGCVTMLTILHPPVTVTLSLGVVMWAGMYTNVLTTGGLDPSGSILRGGRVAAGARARMANLF